MCRRFSKFTVLNLISGQLDRSKMPAQASSLLNTYIMGIANRAQGWLTIKIFAGITVPLMGLHADWQKPILVKSLHKKHMCQCDSTLYSVRRWAHSVSTRPLARIRHRACYIWYAFNWLAFRCCWIAGEREVAAYCKPKQWCYAPRPKRLPARAPSGCARTYLWERCSQWSHSEEFIRFAEPK